MGVIRGRERDCRQEVRGAVERGGTRPTRRVDPQRQAFRPAADEGPHPAEGGRIGTRCRLERQPDCRGAGHQHCHCRADQTPAGRGGVRGQSSCAFWAGKYKNWGRKEPQPESRPKLLCSRLKPATCQQSNRSIPRVTGPASAYYVPRSPHIGTDGPAFGAHLQPERRHRQIAGEGRPSSRSRAGTETLDRFIQQAVLQVL